MSLLITFLFFMSVFFVATESVGIIVDHHGTETVKVRADVNYARDGIVSFSDLNQRLPRFTSDITNSHWSGYFAVTSYSDPQPDFVAVCGSWIVQSVSSSPQGNAAQWIGIGGFIHTDILSSAKTSEVLRSPSFMKLPLCGYQCSPCVHPCLHAIDLCHRGS